MIGIDFFKKFLYIVSTGVRLLLHQELGCPAVPCMFSACRERDIRHRLVELFPPAGVRDINSGLQKPTSILMVGFFCRRGMKDPVSSGVYIISDQYFVDYPNERYMQNKSESRPHYYAIEDGPLFWMIPISSKVANYRKKIEAIETRSGEGNCFMFAIGELSGRERVFVIADMFPVTKEYILRPYTVCGVPLVVQNSAVQDEVRKKANRFLSMVRRGQIKSPLNAMEIRKKLLSTI